MRARMETERLVLRHFEETDAERVQALAGNWKVARMLSRVPHPYPEGAAAEWIATHDAQRADGSAPYAVTLDDELIGAIGIERHANGLEFGYWLGEPFWGRGYATEAGLALRDAAFEETDTGCLTSGYFVQNAASGHVLRKLGFRYIGPSFRDSVAHGRRMPVAVLDLPRDAWETGLKDRVA